MLGKISDAVPVFDKYAWAVWLVIAAILFSPSSWLAPLGIDPLVSMYRPYVGLAFLASSILLLGRAVGPVRAIVTSEIKRRREAAQRLERLSRLTADEKAVIRGYVGPGTRTQTLYWSDGVVGGLVNDQILTIPPTVVREGLPCAHNMELWAYSYLCEHPHLIGLDKSLVGDPIPMRELTDLASDLRIAVRTALQTGRLKGYSVRTYADDDEEILRVSEATFKEWVTAGMPTKAATNDETSQE